jgi:2-oxoglutarate ferredoxin oxidoreductase subunit beta
MRSWLNNIQWCAWCWDTLIIWAIKKAFAELEIESHNRVVVSGVWCSGKASQYIDWYAAETLHGRTLPFATWVKLANPDLTVMAMWGDGDWYGIWVGHFVHACKRDLDITYIVMDNENYALTTGQASPTTPIWAKTKTTPDGNTSAPFDPIWIAQKAGCRFAKTADSVKFAEMKEIIKEAIQHKWFSLVNIHQACPSFKRW